MGDQFFVFINGEYVKREDAKISVFDHGLLYGDGLFEGIRAYNGRVFRLAEHIDRFYNCAKMLLIDIPYKKEELTEIVLETCKRNNLRSTYIRLVATRGGDDLGLIPLKPAAPTVFCIAEPVQLYPEEYYEKGLEVVTSTFRRNKATIIDPQLKSLNYLNNILAKYEGAAQGCAEAIMLNHDGIVAECTGDNLFIVKNGIVFTPPIYIGALDGITRGAVIEICEKLGIPCAEKEFTLYNVYSADECFLTGTAAEVIAVTMADKRVIGGGSAGPVTTRILKAFRELVNTTGAEIYQP